MMTRHRDVAHYKYTLYNTLDSTRLKLRIAFCECVYARDCEWKNLVEPERSFFSVYTWMSGKNVCASVGKKLIKIKFQLMLNLKEFTQILKRLHYPIEKLNLLHISFELKLCQSIFVDSSENSIIFHGVNNVEFFFLSQLATTTIQHTILYFPFRVKGINSFFCCHPWFFCRFFSRELSRFIF